MLAHLLGIAAATALIVFCTVLPFLPGRHDSLAEPLSVIAQVFGKAGLLLVPFGAVWAASGYWSRLAGKQFALALASLIASCVVWAMLSLTALAAGGISLGVLTLALGIYAVSRVTPRMKSLKHAAPGPASPIAFYLLFVPLAVAVTQQVVARPAAEFSRRSAIRNSERFIADIEHYRATHGRYPVSLAALWGDYWPRVIGIKQFYYEPSSDTYNVFFEQPSFAIGTREFVVYNPRDQQVMTSHTMDLLQRPPEQLDLMRGYYALHDTPHPHSKYFLFD